MPLVLSNASLHSASVGSGPPWTALLPRYRISFACPHVKSSSKPLFRAKSRTFFSQSLRTASNSRPNPLALRRSTAALVIADRHRNSDARN